MEDHKAINYIKAVLENAPADWLQLTTHRLDIYKEKLAKTQFLEHFEAIFKEGRADTAALAQLPTAYDYIRLGHPLSCILEWTVARLNAIKPENVISFSSQTIPVMAVLRKNLLEQKRTRILYQGQLPAAFNPEALRSIYDYQFELSSIEEIEGLNSFEGSTIFMCHQRDQSPIPFNSKIDFVVSAYQGLGSVILVNSQEGKNDSYISEIQHVRRRESIAMTPANCLIALKGHTMQTDKTKEATNRQENQAIVVNAIKTITRAASNALVGSSGLSIQYAIMMGLVDSAQEKHPGKDIRFIVPPNCYGGTNDQARRVAACIDNVDVVDLPVDGDNNMVDSIETILADLANEDAIPYIIAEIPTNPRVEVPNLRKLQETLSKERKTSEGIMAVEPVFILDQTFCPNVHFLGEGGILSKVKTIAYVSGSKFPSGGLCTAGYCVGNELTHDLIDKVEKHLTLCNNEATNLQIEILARQLPSMNQRIADAYSNTRDFVNYIQEVLPEAKINFVSEDLAAQGFTPSVFSIDLPAKGTSHQERENYKQQLNHKLIDKMITEIPDESKHCVSYGQLKGCYWTIPATSTQGTTKESDKDYIARVALSPNMDLELHKKVFHDFAESIKD